MNIGKIMFAVAMAAGLVCTAAARTMTMTENRDADGVLQSFNLAFSEESADTTNTVWMVCGTADGGTQSLADWGRVRFVALVPGDVTSVANVPIPYGWGSSVTQLRFVLATGSSCVPNADVLEYIQASGTQYVMTSFIPTGKSLVEVDLAFNDASNGMPSGNQNIFCARGNSATANVFVLFWLSSNWRWDYNNQQLASGSCNTPGTDRHTIRADKRGVYVDGDLASGTNPNDSTFTAGDVMSIFASHGVNWPIGNYGKWKLYSFKAWADGSADSSLELDLVPCRKDGTVCLYNKAGGEFFTNKGTGTFTAGPVVAAASEVEIIAASDLVTTPLQGWQTSTGTFYPYANPLYVVDVTGSNAIDEVEFKKVESAGASVTTDLTYERFIGEARTGTIIKRGGGTLTFNRDLSSFTGPVHVEDGVAIGMCSNCFGKTVHTTSGFDTQRTYVHAGATLVMDDVRHRLVRAEANAILFEGDGYPGLGGALVARNGERANGYSTWQMGSKTMAVGRTKLFVDVPSGAEVAVTYNGAGGQPGSDFSCNGQDRLLYGRTPGSLFGLEAAFINNIGNLTISNMTILVTGNSGRLLPKNGNASTIRFTGGSRWHWHTYDNHGRNQLNQTATVYIDDLEYARFGSGAKDGSNYGVNPWGVTDGTTNNWYCGPVILNDHFRMYNLNAPRHASDKRRFGCTFSAKVSGQKGFRPWCDQTTGKVWGDGLRLNLLYPTNTFEGGIVLDGGSLGVWAEKAVPSQEGAGLVSITNGYVYFGRQGRAPSTEKWVEFTMPVTEFVGSGAVTNGTGVWQGLVKKGEGTLDYNSQLGGAYLDLQGGKVKFSTQYRGEYTGDYAQYAPDGYEAALPAFAKLKGTEGVLDLADAGGAYTVQDMEGTPSVTNGSLTVTGDWTLDVATLAAQNKAQISGTLTFGAGSTVSIAGDITTVPHSGGILVAKAGSVSGLPRSTCKGWALLHSNGELRLYYVAGTTIIFR